MTRFSLRWLFGFVALVGLAIVALKNANEAWWSLGVTIVLLVLSVATVGAVTSLHERRAFWIGCAIFGWAYWIVSTGSFGLERGTLVTGALLRLVYVPLSQEVELPSDMSPGEPTYSRIGGFRNDGTPIHFVQEPSFGAMLLVAHPIVNVGFAFIGGWVATLFHRRARADKNGSNG